MQEAFPSSALMSRINLQDQQENSSSLSQMSTIKLITPRRLDIGVKWAFFKSRLDGGSNEHIDRVYCWHIITRSGERMRAGFATDKWKMSVDDYVTSALALLESMKSGYDFEFPIPVDLDGELLNGSHRVACAIALGIKDVPVATENRRVWAPSWDDAWFAANCASHYLLEDIRGFNKEMLSQC